MRSVPVVGRADEAGRFVSGFKIDDFFSTVKRKWLDYQILQ